ncbi:hypothetical protein F7725_003215 [Dissostichus mawsoni]|uniref:B30.2/SPRY domain-containing protein n=1 Tax=Dissostichus mawsoni TaxID=36200 RepID=A0A7J5YC48_DISMA|nr:hypothetical protein F7725_003215 [Dissostichus mawsoni]
MYATPLNAPPTSFEVNKRDPPETHRHTITRPPRLIPISAVSTKGIMPAPRKAEKLPPYDPNLAEPTTRADFLQHFLPISLDDKTAQKLLWISEAGSKVARTSEAVLCKEGVMGYRAYWEVDYDGWVVIGAVFESAPRKVQDGRGPCGLGENSVSWGAGWSGSCYQVWHNSDNVDVSLPLTSTMGMYVDQPAGIIKLLIVEGEGENKEVQLIHKFKANITEKIYPAFWGEVPCVETGSRQGSKHFCPIIGSRGQQGLHTGSDVLQVSTAHLIDKHRD